jgi:hypothetical protein
MRSILTSGFAFTMMLSSACLAQEWEVAALGGFAWNNNASIVNPTGTAQVGMENRVAFGASFTQNKYRHVSGEIRYMFLAGDPLLRFQGIEAKTSGYANLVHYDLLFHPRLTEERFRPYVAAGGGVKVYSGTGRSFFEQPLLNFALLRPVNQAEPLISLGGGIKYRVKRHVQLQLDFRTYLSPTPDSLFRANLVSRIQGWIFDFVPTLGVSYTF